MIRPHQEATRRGSSGPDRRRRVLIADDSALHLLWLQTVLEGRYALTLVGDGHAAIEHATASRPELILLDVMMPGMDGLAVCRALRARPEGQRIPIILVTSKREEWDVEAGFESGCTDYITKPVDPIELRAKIDSWLEAVALAPEMSR